jgi:hypothetical protein
MRNDSELVLLLVLVISGLSWFIIKALWMVGSAAVTSVAAGLRRQTEEHPVEWHGQAPPVCRCCGYDLRGSPERCSECGARLDPLDSTIVRYMIRLGHEPAVPSPEGNRGPKVRFRFRPGRRGELKYRTPHG